MKNPVLFEWPGRREREAERREALVALHRSDTAPLQLEQPAPRELQWKPFLKFALGLEVVKTLALVAFVIWLAQFHNHFASELRRLDQVARQRLEERAREATTPEERERVEQFQQSLPESHRRTEALVRRMQWLTGFWVVLVVVPPAIHWFLQIRPELQLLREGIAARGQVTGRSNLLGWLPRVAFAFVTERGESILRKQIIRKEDFSLLDIGQPVWVVYQPGRPQRAQIYGLKCALAEILP